MAATYEPIATTTLGSAATSITFSSIAASWTDLRLVLTCSATTYSNFAFRFNSDSGTNYSLTALAGNGSTASSGSGVNLTQLQFTNWFGISTTPVLRTMDIFSYAGSTYKTLLFDEINDTGGADGIAKNVGLWRSTAAVTSIYMYSQSAANFATGTTATLYGIKAA